MAPERQRAMVEVRLADSPNLTHPSYLVLLMGSRSAVSSLELLYPLDRSGYVGLRVHNLRRHINGGTNKKEGDAPRWDDALGCGE
jgi:hypothetical protein